MPEPQNLHIDRGLTNLSIRYKNDDLIWDQVMPVVPVGKRSDDIWVYNKIDSYTIADDTIGPKSLPNEYDWGATPTPFHVTDRALSTWVPQEEVDNADAPIMPMVDANDFLNLLLDLAQENRVAQTIFNSANYASANVLTLTSSNQWDTTGGNAIENILGAIEACFMKGNTVVMGADLWAVFRQLPQILDAVKSPSRYQNTPGGAATVEEMKGLFEIPNWLVGRARYNTAGYGMSASYSRLWGSNFCAVLHVNPKPGIKTITYGATLSETRRITYRDFEGKRGIKGAHFLKVGWNQCQQVIAPDVGYLFVNPISANPTW
jgi:hypothetical protein